MYSVQKPPLVWIHLNRPRRPGSSAAMHKGAVFNILVNYLCCTKPEPFGIRGFGTRVDPPTFNLLHSRYAFDPMDQDQIERQIERCRRLASWITDDDVRQALERLAGEYEAKLTRRRNSFMFGDTSPKE